MQHQMRQLLRRSIASLAAALALGLVGVASAQNLPTDPPPAPPEPEPLTTEPLPDGFDPVAAGLEAEPLHADSLGLTIHLPKGTQVVTERHDGNINLVLHDGQVPPTWQMRIFGVDSSLATPTPAGQVADRLARLERARSEYKVLVNRPVTYRGASGQLCYLEQTAPDKQKYLSSWLIMLTGRGRFLIFSTLTLPENLSRVQAALESSYATMELRSLEQLNYERRRRLEAGQAFLASLDKAALQSLTGEDQWYRMLRLDDRGQPVEIGCQRVEVREGKRGELNPERSPRRFDDAENTDGLLVRVQGRAVIDPETEHYYDWLGIYWVAWDGSEEAWSVRGNEKRTRQSKGDAETGIRTTATPGQPTQVLHVIRSTLESRNREPYQWPVPDVYLSHALTWVLGRVRPAAMVDGRTEVSFYTYVGTGEEPSVSLRTDSWETLDEGGWRHTRHLGSDPTFAESTFDASGRLLRQEMKNGSIMEPIEVGVLRQIWARAGMRLDGS